MMDSNCRTIERNENGQYHVRRPDGSYITDYSRFSRPPEEYITRWGARLAAKRDIKAMRQIERNKELATKNLETVCLDD